MAASYGHYPTSTSAMQPLYGSNVNNQAPFGSSVYGASNTYGGSMSANNALASVYHSAETNSNHSSAYNNNPINPYNTSSVSNPAQSYGSSVYSGGNSHSNNTMNPPYTAPSETTYMSSMYANKPIVRSSDSAIIVPISGINPYSQKCVFHYIYYRFLLITARVVRTSSASIA